MPAPSHFRGAAVHLAGSTTMLPRMRHVAEGYMASQHHTRIVIIEGGGTARGYKALLDRTADVAMASAAASGELQSQLARQRRPLLTAPVARDAIAVLVHASNPVSNLSRQQLANILSGRIANWRDAGGPDAPIHVLVGPTGGGVGVTFRQQALMEGETFTPARIVLENDARLRQAAHDAHAITYMLMLQCHPPLLKVLTIDGQAPRVGPPAYRLHAPLLLAAAGRPAPAAAAFIGYAARQWRSAALMGAGHE